MPEHDAFIEPRGASIHPASPSWQDRVVIISPAYPERTRDGRTIVAAIAVAAGATALGLPYALAWAALAPDIPLIKVEGGVVPAEPAPEQMVAGDGWFALLGVAFGAVAAMAAWWFARRWRGPVVLLALTLGAVAGGALAGWLGQRIGLADYDRALATVAVGADLTHPPALRVGDTGLIPRGVLLVFALAAVVTYALMAGWSRHGTLRPAEPVSSDSWVPPDPPTAPAPHAPDEAVPPRD